MTCCGGRPLKTNCINALSTLGEFLAPIGATRYSRCIFSVEKAKYLRSSGWIGICQKPLVRSKEEKNWGLSSLCKESSILGRGNTILQGLQIRMLNCKVLLSLNYSHDWHETFFIWKGICCSFIMQSVMIPSQVVWLLLNLKKHLNFLEKHTILLHQSRLSFFYPMSFPNDLS